MAAKVCKDTRAKHRICYTVLTAGTKPRSLGCQGIKIFWNHAVDEWECLHVDETVFLDKGVEVEVRMFQLLDKLYKHTVQLHSRYTTVWGCWTGQG